MIRLVKEKSMKEENWFEKLRTGLEEFVFGFFIKRPISFYVNRLNLMAAVAWYVSHFFGYAIDGSILGVFVTTTCAIVLSPNQTINNLNMGTPKPFVKKTTEDTIDDKQSKGDES